MDTKYIPAKIILAIAIFALAIPSTAFAIDSQTLDNLNFLLTQPEPIAWDNGIFDDATLIEGFGIIYEQAVNDENDSQVRRVLWAMGETGLGSFVPILIDELDNETMTACYALGKISSEDSVLALIPMLDHEDRFVREAAVWSLGNITYGETLEDAKLSALEALNERLSTEEETWIADMIDAAITLIKTGIITDPAFDSGNE